MEAPTGPKRPVGIVIIVFLQLFNLLGRITDLPIFQRTWDYFGISGFHFYSILLKGSGDPSIIFISHLLFSLFVILVTIGLWRFKRWAWIMLMMQLGIGLAGNLWLYFHGERPYPGMIITVIMVFYVNQREVQKVFETKSETADTTEKVWTT